MPLDIEGKLFYNVMESAIYLDVVPETIRNYIRSGKLKPAYDGKPILIAKSDVEAIAVNAQ